MADWQQVGPVKVKDLGDKTLITYREPGCGWDVAMCSDRGLELLEEYYPTEADAMSAADAIYDPPKKQIEAAQRGPDWSFWKSGDGTRAAWVNPSVRGWDVDINAPRAGKYSGYYETIEAAELAAAKYVGGEG